MDSQTLQQIKELGVPAFSVIMLLVTAVFLIRNAITERQKSQSAADESRAEINQIIANERVRTDEIQRSFTNQLINEQVSGKQREAELMKQMTQTNQRVVDLQLEIGQVRLDLKQSLIAVEILTRERDSKAADYESEVQARTNLEKRVTALESDLERSKKERRDLSDKYTQLKKEHDAIVLERNKLVADIAQLKRQTQTIPKVE